MKSVSHINKLLIPLLLIACSLCFFGCYAENGTQSDPSDSPIYDGDTGWEPPPPPTCKIEIQHSKFPLDDVTATFYFGTDNYMIPDDNRIPFVELYFVDEARKNYFFVRRTEEEYTSQKYYVDAEGNFNHSEDITIPSPLFTKESGIITFLVFAPHSQQYPYHTGLIVAQADIYYKLENGKVVLSDHKF